jgi:hypothetical protein
MNTKQDYLLFTTTAILSMKLHILISALAAISTAAQVSTVYQFPNGTWLENLAITRNNSILVSLIGKPEVHIVHPDTSTQNLVASFPSANSVLGIAELSCDIFAVAVGSLNPNNTPIVGSFAIYSIDLSRDELQVEKIVDLEKMSMVNGMGVLNRHTLLLADSWAGHIVKLDVRTKQYSIAFNAPNLAANFSSPQVPPLGVNGLRIHNNAIYYSNNVQSILGIIKPGAQFTEIAAGETVGGPDDLAVLRDGSVLLARPAADRVVRVRLDGSVGEQVGVNGPTSVVLTRERNVVFGSTSGLMGGVPREGGKGCEN